MIKLTTSLWTTPMFNDRWNIDANSQYRNTLLMCALCVTYAKSIGCHITMHTDSRGYEDLSKFGYDEVYNDLDVLNERIKTSSTLLWAGGKAIALESEPIGTIHIDNDVFLTKQECADALSFDDCDFIFQHVETAGYKEKELFKDILTNIDLSKDFACCVGVIGFNSEEARKQYVDNYKYWFKNFEYDKGGNNILNADLVLEQVYLYNMMEDMGYRGKALIGDLREESIFEVQKNSAKIGYQHIIGQTKFAKPVIKKLEKTLQTLNPKLYEIIESL